MSWLNASTFSPALPDHCTPTSDFLFRFSSTFHICLPTPLAFISNLLGALSICSWLFAQLPQIYKNYNIKSTSGLSIFFLVEWCLGDLGNLLGALFTHQAQWQVVIGGYYVFVDLCLVLQWVWYERLQHGRHLFRVWPRNGGDSDSDRDSNLHGVVIEGVSPPSSSHESDNDSMRKAGQPRPIFRTPTFRRDPTQDEKNTPSPSSTPHTRTIHRSGPSSPFPSPSPRTMLMLACLVAMTQASPVHPSQPGLTLMANGPTRLETAGTVLSWMSTFLYLGSRLPQIYKNYKLQSTAGLSPSLFAAAFSGNMFYSLALATNPRAWSDMGPHGGHGWVGAGGSDRAAWVAAALPFFLGAAGVLALDASVGVQFMLYGEKEAKVIVVEEEGRGQKWRWRRVSGWMRGWVPSFGEEAGSERQGLLESGERETGIGYGSLP